MSIFASIDANALASWILQTGTMVALLLGLVLIIRRPFAKAFGAKATYALWSIPALRLFVPALTWPAALTPEWLRPAQTGPETLTVTSALSAEAEMTTAPVWAALPSDPWLTQTTPAPVETVEAGLPWVAIMLALWLSVAIIWIARQLWQQYQWTAGLEQHTDPLPEILRAEILAACEKSKLRKPPTVRMSRDGFGPCVTGLWKPIVLVPHNFEASYTAQQRELALIHELTHIRRGDLLAALAALIFRGLNWPNPLVHYAAKRFRLDQEAACDATVMRLIGTQDATKPYAETLVHAAKSSRPSQPETPLGLALSDPSPASTFRA